MKNQRIDYSFGGGSDTVFYSIKLNDLFSAEFHREQLHALYGGKQYYSSRSGYSGKGFLEPNENDLIKFGTYRVDCKHKDRFYLPVSFSDFGEIGGYAPIVSHGGINLNKPFVLTDGVRVAFSRYNDVLRILQNWSKIFNGEYEYQDEDDPRPSKKTYFYHNPTRHGANDLDNVTDDLVWDESQIVWQFYNPSGFKGLDAFTFVDNRQIQRSIREWLDDYRTDQHKHLQYATGVSNTIRGDFLYMDKYGLPHQLSYNPLTTCGKTLPNGWVCEGDGVFWRRRGLAVQYFATTENLDIDDLVKTIPAVIFFDKKSEIIKSLKEEGDEACE